MAAAGKSRDGGLDVKATWKRVSQQWAAEYGETDPRAWLAEHWQAIGDGTEWSTLPWGKRLAMVRGSRQMALGVVFERLYEFCELERPLVETAQWIRVARDSLNNLFHALRQIDPAFSEGFLGYARRQLMNRIDAFEWSTTRFPSVTRELRGGVGRPPSELRDALVLTLKGGGYRAAEIAELVVDPRGSKGARERIYQVTPARNSSACKRGQI